MTRFFATWLTRERRGGSLRMPRSLSVKLFDNLMFHRFWQSPSLSRRRSGSLTTAKAKRWPWAPPARMPGKAPSRGSPLNRPRNSQLRRRAITAVIGPRTH